MAELERLGTRTTPVTVVGDQEEEVVVGSIGRGSRGC